MHGALRRHRSANGQPAWGKLLAAVLIIAGLAAVWRFTPLAELITPEHVSVWARALRQAKWAPAALVLAYTPAEFVMFPRAVLTLLASISFGPWRGFAYGFTGIFVASLATYWAGCLLPRGTVERLAGA